MLPATRFYYGEHLRWSYFWESPNHAGAVLAALIPIVWAAGLMVARSRRFVWIGLLVVEVMLIGLMAKTYSRGALFAFGVALAAFSMFSPGYRNPRQRFGWMLARLAIAASFVAAVGFAGRLAPAFLSGDASVHNRLPLYRGGLALVADQPWGCGTGESGWFYTQWYQPLGHDIHYLGMVNTVIEVAAERGLPVSAAMLFLFLFPPVALVSHVSTARASGAEGRRHAHMLAGTAAGAFAFATASAFTTMSDTLSAWVPLSAGVAVSAAMLWRLSWRTLAWNVLAASIAAVVLTLVLFLAGSVVSTRNSLRLRHGAGFTIVESRQPADEIRAEVVVAPDTRVLGRDYGKQMRELASCGSDYRFKVIDPRSGCASRKIDEEAALVVLAGSQYRLSVGEHARAILLCPDDSPERVAAPRVIALALGGWNELGLNAQWESWARARGVRILRIEGVGQDLRSQWPAVMRDLLTLFASNP
ncbi:MAG: O-antigen ligase family protein [Opitutaceae bacterium]